MKIRMCELKVRKSEPEIRVLDKKIRTAMVEEGKGARIIKSSRTELRILADEKKNIEKR